MDFKKIRKVHLTGIKGVGMTALALYLQDMGINISGSDIPEKFVTDDILKKRNIKWRIGIRGINVEKDTDLLITTAAHGGLKSEEANYAKEKGIKVLTYAEVLAEVSYEKETVCVCGVGGKTSISSILAVLLESAGLDPSFVIGVGNIFPIGVPGKYLKEGRNFICEADDYAVSPGIDNRPKFSLLKPKIVIATNIEYDHPDVYENFEKTKETFINFFKNIPKYGFLVANADNKNTLEVVHQSGSNAITYGKYSGADYQIKSIKYNNQKTIFNLYLKKKKRLVENLAINIPGEYNVGNAVAAYVAGDLLGIDEKGLRMGLERYLGCRRRFEDMGNYQGAKFFDDYAHHPEEIKAALKAVREWFPKRRVVAIFQPHTYSRTKALFSEFSKSFSDADVVALMDIYSSAREKYDPSVSTELLVKEISRYIKNTVYVRDMDTTLKWVSKNIRTGDIVITMGAGDIFHLYEKLRKKS